MSDPAATRPKLNYTAWPDESGHFGPYGGKFVPETLMPALDELEEVYLKSRHDKEFQAELDHLLRTFVGRPTPITFARRLTEHFGGARIYIKREDLAHTGAHKINNALGQALLMKRKMRKTRIVAETGAGQHGVATATAAAMLGIECVVYMGTVDMARQEPNVYRMRLLGTEVRGVESGSKTLKDAINDAIRDWVTNVRDTHYLLGSALGPHPYPTMVRDFQSVIGREALRQMLDPADGPGRLPDAIVACVGGGSNAIGIFSGFADLPVRLVGVEPAGGAAVGRGVPGVVHGMRSYLMQDEYGQVQEAHSISAGLDYPGVGPEHSFLASIGRAEYPAVTDAEVVEAFQLLARTEGIITALESAHALAWIAREAPSLAGQTVVMNLSGRGDKDVAQMMEILS